MCVVAIEIGVLDLWCSGIGVLDSLRSMLFGGFRGCGLLDFRGCLVEMVVVVGRLAGGGLWEWVKVVVGGDYACSF